MGIICNLLSFYPRVASQGEGKGTQVFAGSVIQSMWYTDPSSSLTIINGFCSRLAHARSFWDPVVLV